MAEPTPTAPAPTCYLLDKLPVELRLTIYKHAFDGSRLEATLKNNDQPSSARGPPRAVLRGSKHVALLLTCRTVHDEAKETFWSETALRLKCPPFNFSGRSSDFDAAKILVNSYCYRLCASLPQAVKANVRHVRAMILPALDSNWVTMHPSMTASALLGMFKKLVTCEITPTLAHPVDVQVTHHEAPEDKEQYSRFMMLGKAPAKFLVDRYGLDNIMIDRVAVIFKGSISDSQFMKYGPGKNEVFESWSWPRIRPVYPNFSNGIAFVDVMGKMDEEECYRKVLQAKV